MEQGKSAKKISLLKEKIINVDILLQKCEELEKKRDEVNRDNTKYFSWLKKVSLSYQAEAEKNVELSEKVRSLQESEDTASCQLSRINLELQQLQQLLDVYKTQHSTLLKNEDMYKNKFNRILKLYANTIDKLGQREAKVPKWFLEEFKSDLNKLKTFNFNGPCKSNSVDLNLPSPAWSAQSNESGFEEPFNDPLQKDDSSQETAAWVSKCSNNHKSVAGRVESDDKESEASFRKPKIICPPIINKLKKVPVASVRNSTALPIISSQVEDASFSAPIQNSLVADFLSESTMSVKTKKNISEIRKSKDSPSKLSDGSTAHDNRYSYELPSLFSVEDTCQATEHVLEKMPTDPIDNVNSHPIDVTNNSKKHAKFSSLKVYERRNRKHCMEKKSLESDSRKNLSNQSASSVESSTSPRLKVFSAGQKHKSELSQNSPRHLEKNEAKNSKKSLFDSDSDDSELPSLNVNKSSGKKCYGKKKSPKYNSRKGLVTNVTSPEKSNVSKQLKLYSPSRRIDSTKKYKPIQATENSPGRPSENVIQLDNDLQPNNILIENDSDDSDLLSLSTNEPFVKEGKVHVSKKPSECNLAKSLIKNVTCKSPSKSNQLSQPKLFSPPQGIKNMKKQKQKTSPIASADPDPLAKENEHVVNDNTFSDDFIDKIFFEMCRMPKKVRPIQEPRLSKTKEKRLELDIEPTEELEQKTRKSPSNTQEGVINVHIRDNSINLDVADATHEKELSVTTDTSSSPLTNTEPPKLNHDENEIFLEMCRMPKKVRPIREQRMSKTNEKRLELIIGPMEDSSQKLHPSVTTDSSKLPSTNTIEDNNDGNDMCGVRKKFRPIRVPRLPKEKRVELPLTQLEGNSPQKRKKKLQKLTLDTERKICNSPNKKEAMKLDTAEGENEEEFNAPPNVSNLVSTNTMPTIFNSSESTSKIERGMACSDPNPSTISPTKAIQLESDVDEEQPESFEESISLNPKPAKSAIDHSSVPKNRKNDIKSGIKKPNGFRYLLKQFNSLKLQVLKLSKKLSKKEIVEKRMKSILKNKRNFKGDVFFSGIASSLANSQKLPFFAASAASACDRNILFNSTQLRNVSNSKRQMIALSRIIVRCNYLKTSTLQKTHEDSTYINKALANSSEGEGKEVIQEITHDLCHSNENDLTVTLVEGSVEKHSNLPHLSNSMSPTFSESGSVSEMDGIVCLQDENSTTTDGSHHQNKKLQTISTLENTENLEKIVRDDLSETQLVSPVPVKCPKKVISVQTEKLKDACEVHSLLLSSPEKSYLQNEPYHSHEPTTNAQNNSYLTKSIEAEASLPKTENHPEKSSTDYIMAETQLTCFEEKIDDVRADDLSENTVGKIIELPPKENLGPRNRKTLSRKRKATFLKSPSPSPKRVQPIRRKTSMPKERSASVLGEIETTESNLESTDHSALNLLNTCGIETSTKNILNDSLDRCSALLKPVRSPKRSQPSRLSKICLLEGVSSDQSHLGDSAEAVSESNIESTDHSPSNVPYISLPISYKEISSKSITNDLPDRCSAMLKPVCSPKRSQPSRRSKICLLEGVSSDQSHLGDSTAAISENNIESTDHSSSNLSGLSLPVSYKEIAIKSSANDLPDRCSAMLKPVCSPKRSQPSRRSKICLLEGVSSDQSHFGDSTAAISENNIESTDHSSSNLSSLSLPVSYKEIAIKSSTNDLPDRCSELLTSVRSPKRNQPSRRSKICLVEDISSYQSYFTENLEATSESTNDSTDYSSPKLHFASFPLSEEEISRKGVTHDLPSDCSSKLKPTRSLIRNQANKKSKESLLNESNGFGESLNTAIESNVESRLEEKSRGNTGKKLPGRSTASLKPLHAPKRKQLSKISKKRLLQVSANQSNMSESMEAISESSIESANLSYFTHSLDASLTVANDLRTKCTASSKSTIRIQPTRRSKAYKSKEVASNQLPPNTEESHGAFFKRDFKSIEYSSPNFSSDTYRCLVTTFEGRSKESLVNNSPVSCPDSLKPMLSSSPKSDRSKFNKLPLNSAVSNLGEGKQATSNRNFASNLTISEPNLGESDMQKGEMWERLRLMKMKKSACPSYLESSNITSVIHPSEERSYTATYGNGKDCDNQPNDCGSRVGDESREDSKSESCEENDSVLDNILNAIDRQPAEMRAPKFAKQVTHPVKKLKGVRGKTNKKRKKKSSLGSSSAPECLPPPEFDSDDEKITWNALELFLTKQNLNNDEAQASLKECISALEPIKDETIVKIIVKIVIQNVDEELDLRFTPPAPPLTPTQQRLFALFSTYPRLKGLHQQILNLIHARLFPEKFFWIDSNLETCARFYAALCRSMNDPKPARKMLHDAIVQMVQRGSIVINAVLTTWLEIMPIATEATKYSLPATHAFLILQTPDPKRGHQKQILSNLKNLIKRHYEYQNTESWEEFVVGVRGSLRQGIFGSVDALLAISSRKSWQWNDVNITSPLLDQIGVWQFGGLTDDIASRHLFVTAKILAKYPYEESANTAVEDALNRLVAILQSKKVSHFGEETIIRVLLRVNRCIPLAKILDEWTPQEAVTADLQISLDRFLTKRLPKPIRGKKRKRKSKPAKKAKKRKLNK